jgi:hypothetical protein
MGEVSSISNKSYSRNFMIDSKVILHDIFYDTSVNILRTCPLLYTAGMCDVTYTAVHNIYLHGKCFLYDIICLKPSQSKLHLVSSDSGSHAYATSRSNSLHTDQRHTSCRNTACSVFAYAVNTCDTAMVFLWKANAVKALLPVDQAGTQMDLVYPLKCH